MEDPEPTSDTLPEAPPEPLDEIAPVDDLPALSGQSTMELGAAVEATLDTVDRELAGLEAALEGELEPVSVRPGPIAQPPDAPPADSTEDLAVSSESIEIPGEIAEVLEAESSPEQSEAAIDPSVAIDALEQGPSDEPEPVATDDLASDEPVVSDPEDSPEAQPAVAIEEAVVVPTAKAPLAADPTITTEMAATSDTTAALPAAVETVAVAEESSAPQPTQTWRLKLARITGVLAAPFRAALGVLIVLDWPFSRLNPRVKHLLGCVGVATSIVAVATWLAADRLLRH